MQGESKTPFAWAACGFLFVMCIVLAGVIWPRPTTNYRIDDKILKIHGTPVEAVVRFEDGTDLFFKADDTGRMVAVQARSARAD